MIDEAVQKMAEKAARKAAESVLLSYLFFSVLCFSIFFACAETRDMSGVMYYCPSFFVSLLVPL